MGDWVGSYGVRKSVGATDFAGLALGLAEGDSRNGLRAITLS